MQVKYPVIQKKLNANRKITTKQKPGITNYAPRKATIFSLQKATMLEKQSLRLGFEQKEICHQT